MQLTTVEDLRSIYRPPGRLPLDKVIDRLDEHCEEFIAKSPIFVLSTADASGVCDGSPKGGRPGFVRVLDERTLAWADLSGNNRLDSFENLTTNARVALLFLIPGLDETLRVNGTAELVADPELGAELATDGRPAKVCVVVTVEEAYIHCAKALARSALWDTGSWLDDEQLPSAACILKDHVHIDADVEVIQAARDRDIETTLWQPAG